MKRLVIVIFVVLVLVNLNSGRKVSRITQILSNLRDNKALDSGNFERLHNAYYGAETLYILSKHPGYIQKNVLSTSDFINPLSLFTTELQLQSDSSDEYIGSFISFSNERDYDVYDDTMITSVANSYFAGRVLEIGSSDIAKDSYSDAVNMFQAGVSTKNALRFLSNCRNADGVFRSNPKDSASVTSALYGTRAWNLWSAQGATSESLDADALYNFVNGLYSSGKFSQNGDADGDLRTTYEAVALIQELDLLNRFTKEHSSAKKDIAAFVASHQAEEGYGAAPGRTDGDAVSTFYAVALLKAIGGDVDANSVTDFLINLQALDGGFKLRSNNNKGYYSNTFYALSALEILGTTDNLEPTFEVKEPSVAKVAFIPVFSIYLVIVIGVIIFVLVQFVIVPTVDEDEEEEEEEIIQPEPKKKSGKIKKEAIITVIRDSATGKIVDQDGELFPAETLNKKEWTIIEKTERGTSTIYKIKKKEITRKRSSGRVRKRRNKN